MREELKLDVKIDKVYKMDLGKDLDINRADMNTELANQPATFAWYATLFELAKAKTQKLKNELELLEAELDQKLRRKWDADLHGKMTEAGVSAAIKLNPTHQQAVEYYLQAQKDQGILGVARASFEQRKDMLITIASNMRQEGDSQLTINKEAVKAKMAGLRNSK